MNKRTADKINALRLAADAHGDDKMVSTCAAALAGDAAALVKCGIVVKAAKAAQASSDRKGRRESVWAVPVRESRDSQDLEDLTGRPAGGR